MTSVAPPPTSSLPSVDLACAALRQEQAPSQTAAMDRTTVASLPASRPSLPAAPSGGRPERVDATPRYRSNPLPDYPYLARQRHWEGVVWLLVDVSAQGRVNALAVDESSGYGVLDKAAVKSVRRWRFEPARQAGMAVASQVRVPVEFRLRN